MIENNLSEGSKSYHSENYIYEKFSQVEDTPKKIEIFLKPYIKGKDVLDLGCGTGKYISCFAPLSNKYYGLDISQDQINIAKTKVDKLKNVNFLCSSAENINLPSQSIDIIIATWVLGTILDIDRRSKVVSEMQRILKPNGKIFLVENDIGGEFEIIRGRYPCIAKTKEYNDWLYDIGFKTIEKIDTFFEFETIDEAKNIFSSIWGISVLENIKSNRINHNVVVYSK